MPLRVLRSFFLEGLAQGRCHQWTQNEMVDALKIARVDFDRSQSGPYSPLLYFFDGFGAGGIPFDKALDGVSWFTKQAFLEC